MSLVEMTAPTMVLNGVLGHTPFYIILAYTSGFTRKLKAPQPRHHLIDL